MKSILQEASSIERAIDKAWNEAGKPKEFTIKILDQGERNFLGLTRRPAIVSILYKPEKSTYQQPRARKERSGNSHRSRNDRGRRGESHSGRNDRSNNGYEVMNRESARSERPERSERPSRSSAPQKRVEEAHVWRDEWKQSVSDNLRQMLRHMNIKTGFQAEVTDERVLTISFKSSLLHDEEEQRMLFASLSYLSIQFLKREYKNRFTGFRIVVTGPAPKAKKHTAEKEKAVKAESKESAPKAEAKRDESKQRRPRRQRTESVAASAGDQKHVDEQLKFAKQQLEQDGDLVDVLEQVTADSKEKTSASRASSSEKKASKKAESKQAAAPKEDTAEKKPLSRGAKPLKKDAKYQPFFVMPEEHGSESSGK